MSTRNATPDHAISELLLGRFSPYSFADRPVSTSDLKSLFEAARWAASSYNEQPWTYLVALKSNQAAFDKMLSCLVEGNQPWAKHVPVLALGVVTHPFKRNGKPNKAAVHDLGLASATLTLEATARGLAVHQMIGIVPDRARELYAIPEGSDAFTALAIGYAGPRPDLPAELAERDRTPRQRKPLAEFVLDTWAQPASFLK